MKLVFSGGGMPKEKIITEMEKAGTIILEEFGLAEEDIEVSITFVDSEEIRELNRMYRQVDKVTDVLSFPQFESPEEIPKGNMTTIGDVVICTEQALLQAMDFNHSGEREMVYLFVHSVFHLLGFDHMEEEEKKHMRQEEEKIMKKLGLER